jgi:hypothetical protein
MAALIYWRRKDYSLKYPDLKEASSIRLVNHLIQRYNHLIHRYNYLI